MLPCRTKSHLHPTETAEIKIQLKNTTYIMVTVTASGRYDMNIFDVTDKLTSKIPPAKVKFLIIFHF